MTDPTLRLIHRYRSRGVLVDTNILLLHFVSDYDRELVPRFKRTATFAVDDYDLLIKLLTRFNSVVTTPNVLSEVSNLAGQLGEPANSASRPRRSTSSNSHSGSARSTRHIWTVRAHRRYQISRDSA